MLVPAASLPHAPCPIACTQIGLQEARVRVTTQPQVQIKRHSSWESIIAISGFALSLYIPAYHSVPRPLPLHLFLSAPPPQECSPLASCFIALSLSSCFSERSFMLIFFMSSLVSSISFFSLPFLLLLLHLLLLCHNYPLSAVRYRVLSRVYYNRA